MYTIDQIYNKTFNMNIMDIGTPIKTLKFQQYEFDNILLKE